MTHFGARKTPAQRAAIDARSRAYPHPLSKTQRDALAFLCEGPFVYTVAGWAPAGSGGIGAFASRTIIALERRGFVRTFLTKEPDNPRRRRRVATITRAGHREARRG